jgi:hypothetical protein
MTHANDSIPRGFCQCGCGAKTPIASSSDPSRNTKKGDPRWFLMGHHRRKSPVDYVAEDRGFETPCLMWQGSLDSTGYGQKFLPGGKSVPAHRWHYEQNVGPIPEGLILHHRCEQRACVNWDHTTPTTQAINVQVSKKAKLTPKDIAGIKRLNATSDMTQSQIGDLFGVSGAHVCNILQGKAWKNQ